MDKKFLLTGLAAMLAMQTYAQDTPTSVEMVTVQGGSFYMGNNYMENAALSDEAPEHKVEINSFKMSKTEVTFDLFDLFCDATGWKKPKDASGRRGKIAVYNVSWEAAVMFCNWLSRCERLDQYYDIQRDSASFRVTCNESAKGYRLPTEAEWEYAARGGKDGKPTVYSGSNDVKAVAWCKVNSQNSPHDVGKLAANEIGLFDMSGNVWEWCWDYYDKNYYKNSPASNPRGGDKGPDRVFRGGSWTSPTEDLRLTLRGHNASNQSSGGVGIRLAQNL